MPEITLKEFSTAHPDGRRRCVLCTVPADIERQAQEGRAAGITYQVIGKWLETIVDEPVPRNRLERHFQSNHVRDDA